MRVVVARAQRPPGAGASAGLASFLRDAIVRAGHAADIVTVPFTPDPPASVAAQMLACRLLDLSESAGTRIDRLIALDFPATLLPHEHKVLWLTGPCRHVYEGWGQAGCELFGTEGGLEARDAVRAADALALSEARSVWAVSRHTADRVRRYHGLEATTLYPPPAAPPARDPGGEPYYFVPDGRTGPVAAALALTRQPVRLVFESDVPDAGRRAALRAGCLAVIALPADPDDPAPAIEALGAGRPVITTEQAGAAAELVRHGVTGLVCEPDAGALAEAMDGLWANRFRARLMGELATEAAGALGLSWPRVVECLLA
jgi:hypothetical protein